MKVLIIGATGRTGRYLLKKLLERGDEVTALIRNPAAIKDINPATLHIVKGDARDAQAIDQAVKGQEAILVAFGPRANKKDDLQETLMRNLINAMKKHNVKRIINLSSLGIGDSADQAPFVFKYIIAPLLTRHIIADKERGEALLLASNLDYTNVRPGRLTNTPAKNPLIASLKIENLNTTVAREDVAEFMIAQIADNQWIRKSPLIGYKKG